MWQVANSKSSAQVRDSVSWIGSLRRFWSVLIQSEYTLHLLNGVWVLLEQNRWVDRWTCHVISIHQLPRVETVYMYQWKEDCSHSCRVYRFWKSDRQQKRRGGEVIYHFYRRRDTGWGWWKTRMEQIAKRRWSYPHARTQKEKQKPSKYCAIKWVIHEHHSWGKIRKLNNVFSVWNGGTALCPRH